MFATNKASRIKSHPVIDAIAIWQRGVKRGELRADVDVEVAIDALYSPLFYRLLLKHQPLTDKFVNELVDVVMNGLVSQ